MPGWIAVIVSDRCSQRHQEILFNTFLNFFLKWKKLEYFPAVGKLTADRKNSITLEKAYNVILSEVGF